jgi:hypothetical protein
MRARTTPQRSKRKRAKTHQTPAYTSPTLLMATRNLINMVAVVTTSGAVRPAPLRDYKDAKAFFQGTAAVGSDL